MNAYQALQRAGVNHAYPLYLPGWHTRDGLWRNEARSRCGFDAARLEWLLARRRRRAMARNGRKMIVAPARRGQNRKGV